MTCLFVWAFGRLWFAPPHRAPVLRSTGRRVGAGMTVHGLALLPFYVRRLRRYLREDYALMRKYGHGRIASARYALSSARELAGIMLRDLDPETLARVEEQLR